MKFLQKTFRLSLLPVLFVLSLNLLPVVANAAPTTPAAFTNSDCNTGAFGWLEPWYAYLPSGDLAPSTVKDSNGNIIHKKCDILKFTLLGKNSDIIYILIAVVDDLLRIAGLIAVGFTLYGAFQYVGSQGSPDATAKAQSTIINALIGLAIAGVAVVLVNFLGNSI